MVLSCSSQFIWSGHRGAFHWSLRMRDSFIILSLLTVWIISRSSSAVRMDFEKRGSIPSSHISDNSMPSQDSHRTGRLSSSQSLLSFSHLQKLSSQPKRFANASLKWLSTFSLARPAAESNDLSVIASESRSLGRDAQLDSQRSKWSFSRRTVVRPSQSVEQSLSKCILCGRLMLYSISACDKQCS